MTLEMITGNMIKPRRFVEGLQYWRSRIDDLSSAKLSGLSNAKIIMDAGVDTGSLSYEKLTNLDQIIHHEKFRLDPQQYIEVRFRLRVVRNATTKLRIIGVEADGSGGILANTLKAGPVTSVTEGSYHEISAVIGSGIRNGVDLVFNPQTLYAYFGLEILGANNALLMIEDMRLSLVTPYLMAAENDWVDIRDFGAIGDGVFDCANAIIQADNYAAGRTVFIPSGSYFIGRDLTINAPIRAWGRLVAAQSTAIMLGHRYDLESYVQAFKNETIAFYKAFQALFRYMDHSTLDLNGRSIALQYPLQVGTLLKADELSSFGRHRSIFNGQLSAVGQNWNNATLNANASYNKNDPYKLFSVENINLIEIGTLVSGVGVGREVYVTAVNRAEGFLMLSEALYAPAARQIYKFTRFKFLLDLSSMRNLRFFEIRQIDFDCQGIASAILLPYEGLANKIMECEFTRPRDRAICSYHRGCNGLTVESCNFASHEWDKEASKRNSIAISTHANDMKIRNNRASYYRHFAVCNGSGHIFTSNHWFQESPNASPDRTAGLVLIQKSSKTLIVGNYVDTSWIEITNEHDVMHDAYAYDNPFGGLTITGNIFTTSDVENRWFSFIVLAPYGRNYKLDGLIVQDNIFFAQRNANIDRIERIDTTHGAIDLSVAHSVRFKNNDFRFVNQETKSPVTRIHHQASSSSLWNIDFSNVMPFGGAVNTVSAVTMGGDMSAIIHPLAKVKQGATGQEVQLKFSKSATGTATITAHVDIGD